MEEIPKNFVIAYSKAEIAKRVGELALEIAPWIRQWEEKTGEPILAVCILRGAAFFFADLLRAFPRSVETSFLRTWAYTDESHQRSTVEVAADTLPIAGRAVLLVDEICDSGSTLQKLESMFLSQGAKEVKAAVAISRLVVEPKYRAQWTAFEYPGAEWFVGYGMDSSNRFRNAPDIYRIES